MTNYRSRLKMAAGASSAILTPTEQLHSITSRMTVIMLLTAMRTSTLTTNMISQSNNMNTKTTNAMGKKNQGNEIETSYRKDMSEYRKKVYFPLISLIQI
jgi:hypothetical protein